MIKVIGFDLDNTLWPVKPAILYAEQQLKNHLAALEPGIALPPRGYSRLYGTLCWQRILITAFDSRTSDAPSCTALYNASRRHLRNRPKTL